MHVSGGSLSPMALGMTSMQIVKLCNKNFHCRLHVTPSSPWLSMMPVTSSKQYWLSSLGSGDPFEQLWTSLGCVSFPSLLLFVVRTNRNRLLSPRTVKVNCDIASNGCSLRDVYLSGGAGSECSSGMKIIYKDDIGIMRANKLVSPLDKQIHT